MKVSVVYGQSVGGMCWVGNTYLHAVVHRGRHGGGGGGGGAVATGGGGGGTETVDAWRPLRVDASGPRWTRHQPQPRPP